MRLILASGSARRPELLGGLGLPFEVQPTGVDESSNERDPVALGRELALRKARAGSAAAPDAAVIAADTLVTLDGRFFGKPADAAEARATLQTLRGRTHQVVTGVAVVAPSGEAADVVVAHVTMRQFSDDEIDAYIATGDPLDKSGAYAIQHPTCAPAASVDGCLCSVIGLPLWMVRALLASAAHLETSVPSFERCASCPLRAR
jgi:septum formation protein